MTTDTDLLTKLLGMPKPAYKWRAGADSTPVPDPGDIKVRLDTPFAASYATEYAAAWGTLVARAEQYAIPLLYLQRHTLELVVKEAIVSLLVIRDNMHVGHDLFDLPEPPLKPKEARKAFGHAYEPLFKSLTANLEAFDLLPIPEEFERARTLLEGIEDDEDTRLRYETLKDRWRGSFDFDNQRPRIADIGELTRLLSKIVYEHWQLDADDHGHPTSFMERIGQRSSLVHSDVKEALETLERKTRTQEVKWTLTRTPTLRFTDRAGVTTQGVSPDYLRARYDGRDLVVFTLSSPNGQAEPFLARRHKTRVKCLLWPAQYSSTIYDAAQESSRR
jgi:hypothetical protein